MYGAWGGGGVKQLAMPVFPNQNPDARLVYNRVDKVGSTSILAILELLCKKIGCAKANLTEIGDFPRAREYKRSLESLPPRSVWARHASHLKDMDPDTFLWINTVRDPVERWRSMFEWQKSTTFWHNTGHGASEEVDPCGGPASLGFDECVASLRNQNFSIPSQLAYFCDADPHCKTPGSCEHVPCSLEHALRTMHTYALVGITEHFADSLALFEHLLPVFFLNASRLASVHVQPSNRYARERAHRARNATQPDRDATRNIIRAGAVNAADELRFYDATLQLFWEKKRAM